MLFGEGVQSFLQDNLGVRLSVLARGNHHQGKVLGNRPFDGPSFVECLVQAELHGAATGEVAKDH